MWNEGTVNNWQPANTVHCYTSFELYTVSFLCGRSHSFLRVLKGKKKGLSFSSYGGLPLLFPLLAISSDFAKPQPYCLCILHEYYQENLKSYDVTWYKGPLYVKRLSCTSGVSVRDFVPQKMFPRLRVVVHCIFFEFIVNSAFISSSEEQKKKNLHLKKAKQFCKRLSYGKPSSIYNIQMN